MAVQSAPLRDLEKRLERQRRSELLSLLSPGLLWLILFFAVPLIVIVIYSFMTPGSTGRPEQPFTFNNYLRLFTEELYVNAYVRSLWIGFATTVFSLLIGYPMALLIVQAAPRWRTILLLLVLIPFWTNFLVRTYAWMIILQNNGLLNSLIQALGFPRQTLLNTTGAVLVGLVYGNLPFMVLPLYASIERFDFTVI
jgi:spermidine/putrescine transport system permease protein